MYSVALIPQNLAMLLGMLLPLEQWRLVQHVGVVYITEPVCVSLILCFHVARGSFSLGTAVSSFARRQPSATCAAATTKEETESA